MRSRTPRSMNKPVEGPCEATALSDIVIALEYIHGKAVRHGEQRAAYHIIHGLSRYFGQTGNISKRRGVCVVLVKHLGKSFAVWVRKSPVTANAYKVFEKIIAPYRPDYKILYRLYDRVDIVDVSKYGVITVPGRTSITELILHRVISPEPLAFLLHFLKKGGRILVIGGMASGKITLVSAICDALRDTVDGLTKIMGQTTVCDADDYGKIPLTNTAPCSVVVRMQASRMPSGKLVRKVVELSLPSSGKTGEELVPIYRWIPGKDEYERNGAAFKLLSKDCPLYTSMSYEEISRLTKLLAEMAVLGVLDRDKVREQIKHAMK